MDGRARKKECGRWKEISSGSRKLYGEKQEEEECGLKRGIKGGECSPDGRLKIPAGKELTRKMILGGSCLVEVGRSTSGMQPEKGLMEHKEMNALYQ